MSVIKINNNDVNNNLDDLVCYIGFYKEEINNIKNKILQALSGVKQQIKINKKSNNENVVRNLIEIRNEFLEDYNMLNKMKGY